MAANNLMFHETFQPELTYISKVLELAVAGERGDKFQISALSGIPTGEKKGKVEPHIKYAKYMGLIDYHVEKGIYTLSATKLGLKVWEQDKYLHELLTVWLLHYCISRDMFGAPQWEYIVKKANVGFNLEVSNSHLNSLIQKEFDISNGDVQKAFGVVKSSYMSGCFSSIYYLAWEDNLAYEEKSEQIEYEFLYAYALLDSWSMLFPEKTELTMPEITDDLMFGKVFGLSDDEIDAILESLQDKGVISINRQLFPITIVKTMDTEEAISNLYSMLM